MTTDSILTTIKKMLGIHEEIEDFDMDLIVFINSALAELHQLGIGPKDGFQISGKEETWKQLYNGRKIFNDIKTYVFLKVKIIFDPPQVASLNTAYEKQLKEVTWRLNTKREDEEWTRPELDQKIQQLRLF